MFYRMQSFFTIFLISVLLLSFGTFAEADDVSSVIDFEPAHSKPEIHGLNVNESFKVRKNIRTGEREWIDDNPTVGIGIYVDAYGIGEGQGTLEDITILGNSYKRDQGDVIKVGSWGEKEGTGWYDKGTGSTQVLATTHHDFKHIPVDEVQDSYDWSAEGFITLTSKRWETTVNENTSYSLPLSVRATFGKSGKWVDGGSRERWAASGTHGKHELIVDEYDPLSVSFNKTDFTADEELEVTVTIEGVKWAYLQVGSQFPISMSPTSSDTIKVSSGLSHLNFGEQNYWYNKVYGAVLFKSDGKTYYANFEQYISVKKPEVGYFEESTLFNGYGTYNAKVVESNPIKKVIWSIQKPGVGLEEDTVDKVNGGKTSSWSYSISSKSTSGRYRVQAEVHFETNATTYESSFYVY